MPTCATSRQCGADLAAVADDHELVDLRPGADRGAPHRRALDRAARADLDVVFDDHVAHLRDLVMHALVRRVAVAVRADRRARVDDARGRR